MGEERREGKRREEEGGREGKEGKEGRGGEGGEGNKTIWLKTELWNSQQLI